MGTDPLLSPMWVQGIISSDPSWLFFPCLMKILHRCVMNSLQLNMWRHPPWISELFVQLSALWYSAPCSLSTLASHQHSFKSGRLPSSGRFLLPLLWPGNSRSNKLGLTQATSHLLCVSQSSLSIMSSCPILENCWFVYFILFLFILFVMVHWVSLTSPGHESKLGFIFYCKNDSCQDLWEEPGKVCCAYK